MHAEQANLRTSTPILTKKRSYLFEDFDIKLSWGRHGMGACDGSEIFIAQLELDGARVQATVAQAATHHLREAHQGSFQLLGISRVFIVGMLVADRLGISIGPHLAVEPAAGIFATCFARQRQSPLSETLLQKALIKAGKVLDLSNPKAVQVSFCNLSDPRNFAHIEWSEEINFLSRHDPKNSVWFGSS